jgi:hypothetical protein
VNVNLNESGDGTGLVFVVGGRGAGRGAERRRRSFCVKTSLSSWIALPRAMRMSDTERFACLRRAFTASPALVVIGEGDGEGDLEREDSDEEALDCSSSSTMM